MVKKTVRQRARELRISIFSYLGEVDLSDFRALVVRLNESNYNEAFNALFSRNEKKESIEFMLQELAALHGRLECKKKYEPFVYFLRKYLTEKFTHKNEDPFLIFVREAYNRAAFTQYGENSSDNCREIRTFSLAIYAILQLQTDHFDRYEELIAKYFVEGFCLTVAVEDIYVHGGPKMRWAAYRPDRFWNFNNSSVRYCSEESYRWGIPLNFEFQSILLDILGNKEAGNRLLRSIISRFKKRILQIEGEVITDLPEMRTLEAFSQLCRDLGRLCTRFDYSLVKQGLVDKAFLNKLMNLKLPDAMNSKNFYSRPLWQLFKRLPEIDRPPMPEPDDKDFDFFEFIYNHPEIKASAKWDLYFMGAQKFFQEMPKQSIVNLMRDIAVIKKKNWGIIIPYIPFSRFSVDPLDAETVGLTLCLKRMENKNPANFQKLRDFFKAVYRA
jgi:hypothetical protein